MGCEKLVACLRDGGVFMDVKSAFEPAKVGNRVRYWSL
jgi:hypothetical protein